MDLLGYQGAGEVFLGRDHIAGEPEQSYFLKEGIGHFCDGLFKAHV